MDLIHTEMGVLTSKYPMRVWHWYRGEEDMLGFEFRINYYGANSVDEARYIIGVLGQGDLENLAIQANAFGLQIQDGVSWTEWLDEEGQDIMEVIDDER